MPLNVTHASRAIQYTGSNGAEVDAAVSVLADFAIVSESGGDLVWNVNGGSNRTTATGEWIVYVSGDVTSMSDTMFLKERMCVALCSELAATDAAVAALDVRVDDLEGGVSTLSTIVDDAFVRSMGVAAVPTLLLGGTATVPVQLQPAMSGTSYSAYASKFAGVSLTDLQINSVTVVDTDTVNVAVENVGLGTITGASVMVHAID